MRTVFFVSVACISSFLVTGCTTVPKEPDWLTRGAGAFSGDKKALYGVGLSEGIKDESLRRMTSDNRAIADISKQLTVISTSLMRDYMSSASATEEEKSMGEQYVESTVKTFSDNVITGVKIIDRWDDGRKTYSLARIGLDDIRNLTERIRQLSQSARDHIRANAERAFDRLEKEQQKRSY